MASRSEAVQPSSSLDEQLLQLLQQQVAIEECLSSQRALMQRITEGFSVLREWASRHAHHDLTLHDLLVLEAYGGGNLCHSAAAAPAPPPQEVEKEGNEGASHRREYGHGRTNDMAIPIPHDDRNENGNVHHPTSGNLERWQQRQQLQEAKRAYRSFIRARVLDEECTAPDNPVQFHALSADSFYLLLPQLTEMLTELLGIAPGAARVQQQQQQPLSSLLSLSISTSFTSLTDWCASLARVLRFLELGLKHFPEVLENSPLRPCLVQNLLQLQEVGNDQSHAREEAVLQLCQRAEKLCAHLHRLPLDGSHKYE
ncbi:hypothetical protein MOQ_010253 [Trypanosoma cruzi marinkellei]|uniref:Uncharacterized protein n=1 Tax=Trypanosoma cruzi marinkellei TaxID=85056 RepID=K2MG24_TRYCR|nr:hypothetical protein MOQ_010253 [Trypanosoma cruzi marinkellei]